MFLLDTNVVSEPSRPQPDEHVLAWLRARKVGETYLSIITLAELEQGIVRLGSTRRAAELRAFLGSVETQFVERVLGIDRAVARTWAGITAGAAAAGRPMSYPDSYIAATALTHGLTIVTRNVPDFEAAVGRDRLVNPWEAAQP